jgi:pimeloyl-ACP methyl ester carboxylesterase
MTTSALGELVDLGDDIARASPYRRRVSTERESRRGCAVAYEEVNGARLYYERHGQGDPLVLVHGSWVNAASWDLIVPRLAESFQVLVYDRRGHSRSERPEGQGSVHEDVDDLGVLLETLYRAPAHVVTNSLGGNIALRLAAKRPELVRSLCCQEPPLFGLLADDPEGQELLQHGARTLEAIGERIAAGDHEGAARTFVEEMVLGPDAWDEVPPQMRAVFVENAPTFLDELLDPDVLGADRKGLTSLEVPTRLTEGSETPPVFSRVIDRLMELVPNATRETIKGTGHVPELTDPERYIETIVAFAGRVDDLVDRAREPKSTSVSNRAT